MRKREKYAIMKGFFPMKHFFKHFSSLSSSRLRQSFIYQQEDVEKEKGINTASQSKDNPSPQNTAEILSSQVSMGVQTVIEDAETEKMLEQILDRVILEDYERIDEGENGIIGIVNLEKLKNDFNEQINTDLERDLEPEQIDEFFNRSLGISSESTETRMALKMLKIYSEEAGEKEVKMQKIAHNIVQKEKEKNPNKSYADIPQIHLHSSVNIDPDSNIAKKLEKDHVKIEEGKAYIVAMDYVPGADFMTYVYRKVLIASNISEDICENMSLGELETRISDLRIIRDFSIPQIKEGEDLRLKRYEVNHQNIKKCLAYLSKEKGFNINKEIPEQLRNTLNALHYNGIAHLDLHPRNVIISGGKDIFVIDFGMSQEFRITDNNPQQSLEGVYSEKSKDRERFVRDDVILALIEKGSVTKSEKENEEKTKFFNNFYNPLHGILEKINAEDPNTNKKMKERYAMLIDSGDDQDDDEGELGIKQIKTKYEKEDWIEWFDDLIKDFIPGDLFGGDQEMQWNLRIALLEKLCTENKIPREEFLDYLDSLRNEKQPQFIQNQRDKLLRYWREEIENIE